MNELIDQACADLLTLADEKMSGTVDVPLSLYELSRMVPNTLAQLICVLEEIFDMVYDETITAYSAGFICMMAASMLRVYKESLNDKMG